MTPLMEWLNNPVLYALGWTLLHSLWQGALVALLLTAGLRLTRSPNARYLGTVAALALVVLLGAVTFGYYFQLVTEAMARGAVDTPAPLPGLLAAHAWLNAYMPHIVMFWLVGFGFFLLRYLGSFYYCQRLKIHFSQPAPAVWQERIPVLAERIGLTRAVQLKLSARVAVPCVIGHLKPAILLPAALLTQLSRAELEAVLLHELGHIRRNDYLVGLIQSFIRTLYFFNWPVLWISAQIDREREFACDDIAVNGCKSRTFYAETLARLSELSTSELSASAFSRNGGLTMTAIGQKKELFARIQRLFETRALERRPGDGLLASTLILVLGLFLSVQSQAEASYPGIETYDDATVAQMLEAYKEQVFWQPGKGRLITSLAPSPEFENLSETEQQAFIDYLRKALRDSSSTSDKRDEMWEDLSDEEWQDLQNTFFEQHFGHFFAPLSADALSLDTYRESIPEVDGEATLTLINDRRMEAVIPLDMLRLIHNGELSRIAIGPMQLFAQDDGRLVMTVPRSDDMPALLIERAVVFSDLKSGEPLSGPDVSLTTSAMPDDPAHSSYFASETAFQVAIGRPAVEEMLLGKTDLVGNALAGYRVTEDRKLELALEPEKQRQLGAKVRQYVPADRYITPGSSDDSLEDKLARLPSNLHQYLYTPEQLERWFAVRGVRRDLPVSEREKPFWEDIYQHQRVDTLLEAYEDPEQDAETIARQGVSTFVGTYSWWVIVPSRKVDQDQLFEFVVEERPFEEVVLAVAERCQGADLPDTEPLAKQPVSLYGYETYCRALENVLNTMADGGPQITRR